MDQLGSSRLPVDQSCFVTGNKILKILGHRPEPPTKEPVGQEGLVVFKVYILVGQCRFQSSVLDPGAKNCAHGPKQI